MKNYTKFFFILFISFPFVVFSQNKKKLKGDISLYKDSIIQLQDSIYYIKKELVSKDLNISKLESKIQNLEKENIKLQNKLDISDNTVNEYQKNLNHYQKELSNLNTEYSNLNLKLDNIKLTEIKLNDSIDFLNDMLIHQISQIDSLNDIEFQNTVSLAEIIENSEFDYRDVYGSWDLKTLFLSQQREYINFEYVYSFDSYNDKKFKADNSVLEKIVLMDPNIAIIELKDGNKISCLFEITKAESGSRKNMAIKFVDTDREEFKFVISEFEGAYIYKYDYSSLLSFFDRNEYGSGYTENFRIRGVTYEYNSDVLSDYDLHIVGIIK